MLSLICIHNCSNLLPFLKPLKVHVRLL
uniref:Uncharacterized protein n=1 Tax=Anguilla anguilla TaxID=7936 RepID=A0A0E9RCF7_ANGAN